MTIVAASKNLTPSQRQTRSRHGSHKSWANTVDRTARTAPGRAGLLRKFEDQVDPDRTLTPEDRAKRAESARKAYYTRLSMLAVKARQRQRAGEVT
jgi:hypothetical protein